MVNLTFVAAFVPMMLQNENNSEAGKQVLKALKKDHHLYFEGYVLKAIKEGEETPTYVVYLCGGPKLSKLNSYSIKNKKIERTQLKPTNQSVTIAKTENITEMPPEFFLVFVEYAGNHGYNSSEFNEFELVDDLQKLVYLKHLEKMPENEGIHFWETAVV